ncbi:GbsR/MarR family transcriptional regulator [Woodsholea maritima]|uniref:GbsR/MarR family transcriptional regulator n=1 Tax=Woodsholea maritima TaxID=240237 RepID=UPI000375DE5A|nr:MarR family transcriptional regulator [Woodsholea maritima]
MQLTPAMEKFILHWGEMGMKWGVNRSIAQIHALLILAEDPLTAEEITDTLTIARSNVSNSIKELLALKLVERVHIMGDRRDHFTAQKEPWDMLMAISEARKQREIDPTLVILRDCVAEGERDGQTTPEALMRLKHMLEFIENLSNWYDQVRRLPKSTLITLMKMGSKVASFVGGKSK